MKKFFVPLFLVLLMSLSCYAVASAEEIGGTYIIMPDEVMVGADGKASFDILMTPNDTRMYAGYQFHSVPGTNIEIEFVQFSK
jgi:hypothetical protein